MNQSNNPTIDIDSALVQEFIDEAMDTLSSLDSQFVELEKQPEELSIIETIFRPVHSIKGNSGFFGFGQIKQLAHELETLLDLIRKGKLPVSGDVISVLLSGMDALREMFLRVKENETEIPDGDTSVEQLVAKVKAVADGNSADATWQQVQLAVDAISNLLPQDQDNDLFKQFAELQNHLHKLNPIGKDNEASDDDANHPLMGYLKTLQDNPEDESTTQKLLEALRENQEQFDAQQVIDQYTDAIETMEVFVNTVGLDELGLSVMEDKIKALPLPATQESQKTPQATQPTEQQTQPAAAAQNQPAKHHETQKTMRVSEACIDNFLEYVGDLIVVGDMYSNVYNMMIRSQADRKLITTLKRTNETFASLSHQLQESIMSIRRVPVGTLLQKVPRLVRDIAKSTGKNIRVNVTGDGIEMDKSLLDLLDAPLVHMVRNSADHGIEMSEDRVAAGKSEHGNIDVNIEETDSRIKLTIIDDGGGIRLDKIKAKAESMGMIEPGQNLSDDDLINCLFASGVSTAETITDVSGRGVGMDVVKRMIDEADGSINIQTELGTGTTVVVDLPKSVTTQIMSAYLLDVAGQKFALPLNCILETVCIDPNTVKTVMQSGQLTYHNDSAFPLVDLKQTLGIEVQEENNNGRQILVLVKQEDSTVAVKIDQVLGIQQIVLCKIDGMEDGNELIQGGAQMGDGSIVLILNPQNLQAPSPQATPEAPRIAA